MRFHAVKPAAGPTTTQDKALGTIETVMKVNVTTARHVTLWILQRP